MLNTRQRLVKPPEGAREGSRSILDFGLPAARGTNLATPEGRKELGRAIEAAIQCYEPRVRELHVSVEPGGTPLDPLKVVIDGTLATGLEAEPIHVLASLAARSGRVSLEEGGR